MFTIDRKRFYKLSIWLLLQSIVTLFLFYYIEKIWVHKRDTICPLSERRLSLVQSECQLSKITLSTVQPQVMILLWVFSLNESYLYNQNSQFFGIAGCLYTTDRTLYKYADAVIFHHSDIMHNLNDLPQMSRPPNQLWIWFNLEPPSRIQNLGMLDRLMNLTMTYRLNSDIFTPYGSIILHEQPQNFTIPPKFKLVASTASNWDQPIRRVQYYTELNKHIQVDMFEPENLILNGAAQTSVLSEYKFYLAFEDSENQDYITEKLWNNALLSRTVPVVLGPTRENYERFLPAEAFIHVDDFPSANELAEYLLMLEKNDEKYQMYFTWRSQYKVVANMNWQTHYCKACYFLQGPRMYMTIPSLVNWFTGS